MSDDASKRTSSSRQPLDAILESDFCNTKVQHRNEKVGGKRERCRLKLGKVQQFEKELEDRDPHVRCETSKLQLGDNKAENFTDRDDVEASAELSNGRTSAGQPEAVDDDETVSTDTSNIGVPANGVQLDSELLADQNAFICELCGKDLAKFNSVRRHQHVNRCCDENDRVKDQERKPENVTCPLCSQLLRQERNITSHLKICGARHSVAPAELIKIIEDVKRHWQIQATIRQGRGIKRGRPPAKKQKKRKLQPERGMDDDLLLALALSVSMSDEKGSGSEMKVKRQNKTRARLKNVERVPALLLQSKEQEEEIISARAGRILIPELADSQEITPTPAFAASTIAQQIKAPLQSRQEHQADDIESSPVSEPEIEYCNLQTGDKDVDKAGGVEMTAQSSDPECKEQLDVQDPIERPHIDFWSLTSTRLSEASVEQYYVPGLVDIPDHVRAQFERWKHADYLSDPVKSQQTDKVIQNEEIGNQTLPQVYCQQSQGFIMQPSPKNDFKATAAIEKATQTSVDLSGCEELLYHFRLLINSPLLSDVTLVARDNHRIYSHQAFLAARSPVFAKMFSDTDEDGFTDGSNRSDGLQTEVHSLRRCAVVSLDNASSGAVMAMVHYIYTGTCRLQQNHIEEILWLANRFQLNGLRQLCETMVPVKELSSLSETMEATPTTHSTSLQRSGEKETVENSEQRLPSPAGYYSVDCTEIHLSCSQPEQSSVDEITRPLTQNVQPAQVEPSEDDGCLSPQRQLSREEHSKPYLSLSPRVQWTDNEANVPDDQLPCSPMSDQSVASTERLLEQAVCDSPDLPSLCSLMSESPLPTHLHAEQTVRNQDSNCQSQSEVLAWDTNLSKGPFSLSDIRTPCVIPETPMVLQGNAPTITRKANDVPVVTAPIHIVWNSPQEQPDSEDNGYLMYEDESQCYNDWVDGDYESQDAHHCNQETVTVAYDRERCSSSCNVQHCSDPPIPLSDASIPFYRDNQFGDENSMHKSMVIENSEELPFEHACVQNARTFVGSPTSSICGSTDVRTNVLGSSQPTPTTSDPIGVDMCDEEDELFVHCLPDDCLLTVADNVSAQQSDVTEHQCATPCVPCQQKATKGCVTPMPDYDNMETPYLKRTMGKFGMRNMAKKKMICKLKQVYHYTHPCERAEPEEQPVASNNGCSNQICRPAKSAK